MQRVQAPGRLADLLSRHALLRGVLRDQPQLQAHLFVEVGDAVVDAELRQVVLGLAQPVREFVPLNVLAAGLPLLEDG